MLLFHYLVTSQMEPLLWFHITQNKIQHPCDGLQSPELSGPRPLLSSISHPPAPSSHTGLPAIPWTHQAHCHPRPFVLTAASALAPPPPPFTCITCSLITSVRPVLICHLLITAFSGYLIGNGNLPFPFPHSPYSFFLLYCAPSQVAPPDILCILIIYVFIVCHPPLKYRLPEGKDFILFTALSLTSGIEPGT